MRKIQTDVPTRRLTSWLSRFGKMFAVALAVSGTVVLSADTLSAMELPEGVDQILTCDLRSKLVDELKDGYAEKPVALGVTSAGTVMELWTAQDGKTWTLLVTMDDQNSCVLGAGDNWMEIQQSVRGKGP